MGTEVVSAFAILKLPINWYATIGYCENHSEKKCNNKMEGNYKKVTEVWKTEQLFHQKHPYSCDSQTCVEDHLSTGGSTEHFDTNPSDLDIISGSCIHTYSI